MSVCTRSADYTSCAELNAPLTSEMTIRVFGEDCEEWPDMKMHAGRWRPMQHCQNQKQTIGAFSGCIGTVHSVY